MANAITDYSEIVHRLGKLRQVDARTAQLAAEGRERFLAQFEALGPPGVRDLERNPSAWGVVGALWVQKVAAGLTIAIAASLGLSVVAQNALPGEVLFPVKVSIEDVQVRWETSREERVRLLLRNASRRVEEIRDLVRFGNSSNLHTSVDSYLNDIDQLNKILLEMLASGDLSDHQLLSEISRVLMEHESEVIALLTENPDIDPTALNRILSIAQSGTLLEDDDEPDTTTIASRIVSVNPSRGEAGRTMSLYVQGEAGLFSEGIEVRFNPSGAVVILDLQVLNADEIIVRIRIAPGAEAGQLSLVVENETFSWEAIPFEIIGDTRDGDSSNGGEERETDQEEEDESENGNDEDDEDDSDEDSEDSTESDGDHDSSGPGNGKDDEIEEDEEEDNSGPGSSNDHDEEDRHDNSGPGSSSDDDKEDDEDGID